MKKKKRRPTKRERELNAAIEPFARVFRICRDIGAGWPDDRPAREILPGIWPTWGDLKRAGAVWKPKNQRKG